MDILDFLYKTVFGRAVLGVLIKRPVSEAAGRLLDSRASKILIAPFAKKNHIALEDYKLDNIKSFNDFFCRRIKDGLRPFDDSDEVLSAPCDGLLSAYKIDKGTVLSVKQSKFDMERLLRDKKLAEYFEGGYALVFRLRVDHYHRYMYFSTGKKYKNRKIAGVYHTVRPTALESRPVFTENSREYAVIDTKSFGRCVQMEVGAMLVGRIVNRHKGVCVVRKGMEKGKFEYGGSTVILLLPKGKASLRRDIEKTLNTNTEIPVKMGMTIGEKL